MGAVLADPLTGTLKAIRQDLGLTQRELGQALAVSIRAVQSYEQGWRRVPEHVMRQLFVMLAVKHGQFMRQKPCWQVAECPVAVRRACVSPKVGGGRLCWFVTAGECRARRTSEQSDGFPCLDCAVVDNLLAVIRN